MSQDWSRFIDAARGLASEAEHGELARQSAERMRMLTGLAGAGVPVDELWIARAKALLPPTSPAPSLLQAILVRTGLGTIQPGFRSSSAVQDLEYDTPWGPLILRRESGTWLGYIEGVEVRVEAIRAPRKPAVSFSSPEGEFEFPAAGVQSLRLWRTDRDEALEVGLP